MTALDVKVGERDVFVKLSAFADLANVKQLVFEDTSLMYYRGSIEVDVDRPAFRVVIRGSDAGNAYVAMLDFSTVCLERRSVWMGEFPASVSEVTVYKTR
jgi:hypothetical protein